MKGDFKSQFYAETLELKERISSYSLLCLIPFHDLVDLRPLQTTLSVSFLVL